MVDVYAVFVVVFQFVVFIPHLHVCCDQDAYDLFAPYHGFSCCWFCFLSKEWRFCDFFGKFPSCEVGDGDFFLGFIKWFERGRALYC